MDGKLFIGLFYDTVCYIERQDVKRHRYAII